MSSLLKQISIIVPCAPGTRPDVLLSSLAELDYPRELQEVIVVEGKQPSRQRNEAIKKANGEIIFFFDDDVTVGPGVIRQMVRRFDDDRVAIVGGPSLTPKTDSRLQHHFGCVMASCLATSSMSSRYRAKGKAREADERDLTLCNLSARKSVLDKEGAFEESLWPNEENHLLVRLHSRGYKLIYEPRAIAYHSRRPTLKAFVKQLFGCGRGRAEQILLQPSSFRPIFAIPALFLLYTLSLLFVPWGWGFQPLHSLLYCIPLFLYVLYCLLGATMIALEEKDLLILPWLFVLFPFVHFPYGAGFIFGFFRRLFRREQRKAAAIRITVLK